MSTYRVEFKSLQPLNEPLTDETVLAERELDTELVEENKKLWTK